jgi:hypothetical protein
MAKRRGEVVAVKDLFAKYRSTLIAPQKTVELEMIRAVGEVCNFTLKEEQVVYTVSTKTISLRVPAVLRQEIKLREKDLLKVLAGALGKKNAPLHVI